ncbi:MAG: OadG family protein [Bacteroidales bacterium]|nr:OadG family protein [Bacteroidales bacterium]
MLSILLNMTKGAEAVARTDPHGFILSLIAVMVVFSALLILYGIYSLTGHAFTGGFKRARRKPAGRDAEVAAAIAIALKQELSEADPEVAAAIALALELNSGGAHDSEPYVITIDRKPSAWQDKALTFRKMPLR